MSDRLVVSVPDLGYSDTFSEVLNTLVAERVASRLFAKDPTLWGPAAEPESKKRLGWTEAHEVSRALLAEIDALSAELRAEGLTRVVLCGMGGSSLAPEVITRTAGVDLVVLDTTDPARVRRALETDLERTVVVVSSKSGGTVETDSQRRAFVAAFEAAGIDPASRIVIVTDPGSPLELASREAGYRRVFLADPNVGGRYSALTAFGLVPSALAGADVATLLDDCDAVVALYSSDSPDNPALVLGAAMAAAHAHGAEKLVIGEHDSGIRSFGAWAEQLIAESTGKDGLGVLPVDVGSVDSVGWADAGSDCTRVSIGSAVPQAPVHINTDGPLGALMLLWEAATAIASRPLGISPFDQPNVEEAKIASRAFLDAPPSADVAAPELLDGVVEVHGELAVGAVDLAAALEALLASVPEHGYLAVLAYLDSEVDAAAEDLRGAFARRLGRQVTFGWGPRFLHSTGQYHKGGHQNGVFVELTGTNDADLPVPERPYTFGSLIAAQAAGDLAVLVEKGRPTLRLHLTDRSAGISAIAAALDN